MSLASLDVSIGPMSSEHRNTRKINIHSKQNRIWACEFQCSGRSVASLMVVELVSKYNDSVSFLQMQYVLPKSDDFEGFRALHYLLLVFACDK